MKLAILLTCFNRREKTVLCLQSLSEASVPDSAELDIFLVDDGCTDGTAEAAKEIFPDIHIIRGTGNLFWAGGMRLAFESAGKHGNYDGFLLLNDDVILKEDFLKNLLETQDYSFRKHQQPGLYAASTFDTARNTVSYGGNVFTHGPGRLRYALLEPAENPQPCDFTNANILLIDSGVIEAIGFFDPHYRHAIADYDFSLRAKKAGFPVYITAGYGGYCENDHIHDWSTSRSLRRRIQHLKSPTGLEYEGFVYFIEQHFPRYKFRIKRNLWLKTLFPFLWKIKAKIETP